MDQNLENSLITYDEIARMTDDEVRSKFDRQLDKINVFSAIENRQPTKILFDAKEQRYLEVYDLYLQQQKIHWDEMEIDAAKDFADWESLSKGLKISTALSLKVFAGMDDIVNDNLEKTFSRMLNIFYKGNVPHQIDALLKRQNLTEVTHKNVYSSFILEFTKKKIDFKGDDDARQRLQYEFTNEFLSDLKNVPEIREKYEFINKYYMINDPAELLLLCFVFFGCVEGIQFISAFVFIFYLDNTGKTKKLSQLIKASELIFRDENLHTDSGAAIYAALLRDGAKPRLDSVEIYHGLLKKVVELECNFAKHAMSGDPLDFNFSNEDIFNFIKYRANRICSKFFIPTLYPEVTEHNITFMNNACKPKQYNFFETESTEYKREFVSVDLKKFALENTATEVLI